ncbi:MAG: hypothetical protein C4518_12740 [Desulfobacteraceae bacterium]|nr:MAG: hypothetical protein C4518_12740 [Desulfobacteraceae bacterium]
MVFEKFFKLAGGDRPLVNVFFTQTIAGNQFQLFLFFIHQPDGDPFDIKGFCDFSRHDIENFYDIQRGVQLFGNGEKQFGILFFSPDKARLLDSHAPLIRKTS